MKEEVTTNGDWYAERLAQLEAKPNVTEADVSSILVRPVLEQVLGFNGILEIEEQKSTWSQSGELARPDFLCRRQEAITADVIAEVKKFGTDLTKRVSPNAPWETSPVGQLQRYVNGLRESSSGTFGIVTNGREWVVLRRGEEEVSQFAQLTPKTATTLSDLEEILCGITFDPPPRKRKAKPPPVDWLASIAVCDSPAGFLKDVFSCTQAEERSDIAFHQIGEHRLPEELIDTPVYLICLKFDFPDGVIAPEDITAKLIEKGGDSIGVAYINSPQKNIRLCRGFIYLGGVLRTTALIEPQLPGSRAANQFAALATAATQVRFDEVVKALSTAPLHRSFHEEIGEWFKSTNQGTNELRHLIRVMFVYLLQERKVIPDNTLWDQGRIPKTTYEVHSHVNWLFTQVFSTPKDHRKPPKDEWQRELCQAIPFLNGSLFAKLPAPDRPQKMKNNLYLDDKGLLSILGRYDWTLHERTGYATESAIDPNMLGEMFEQLILKTQGIRYEQEGDYTHHKMPHGTYYTPQDVADEMAADAIAGFLAPQLEGAAWEDVRALAHPTPTQRDYETWSHASKKKAIKIIDRATVLDPCCGSGAFTMAMLHALRRVKERLSSRRKESLEKIVARQIYAVDIEPMAVFITRLRLFIALVDSQADGKLRPLPNLETRCVTANTLNVQIREQKGLGDEAEVAKAIAALRSTREKWTSAHLPEEKKIVISEEREARAQLKSAVGNWGLPEELDWLDVDLRDATAPPAQFDIRRLFPAPTGGWDIIIGNPPYQIPDHADEKRGLRLGYTGAKKNLFLMFIEAAVVLARKGGYVTLIVPHSIVFSVQPVFRNVRAFIEANAEEIDLRTYDNRPQPVFPRLPWLKEGQSHDENRQRVTILRFRKKQHESDDATQIRSGGLFRISADKRGATLRCGGTRQLQKTWAHLWSQAPTQALHQLLCVMRDENKFLTQTTSKARTVTFPPTAMYFISCLTEDALENEGRMTLNIPDGDSYWPWIGLYNSHLFHAYWLMVGDAFHVTKSTCQSICPPKGWQDERIRAEIEENAMQLMKKKTLKSCFGVNNGVPNIDFHKEGSLGPPVIETLDKLLLEAYGLDPDPLLEHMRVIRVGSAHVFQPNE